MELPIFSDNLKSSASWTGALERERDVWRKTREAAVNGLRQHQVRQILLRDAGLNDRQLWAATESVSSSASEPDAKLSVGRLLEIHGILIGAPATEELLRKTEPAPINAMHDPTPAILLPRMLDNAFDWFASPSFNELHPVEQAAVVYLRLLDLHPFPLHTATTALLAAGFYTERSGLPPLIIPGDEATIARFDAALEAAFRMLTQPLVEFFAEMLTTTMRLDSGTEK
jgi:hypothetical protein